jgi:hypothetical protein
MQRYTSKLFFHILFEIVKASKIHTGYSHPYENEAIISGKTLYALLQEIPTEYSIKNLVCQLTIGYRIIPGGKAAGDWN